MNTDETNKVYSPLWHQIYAIVRSGGDYYAIASEIEELLTPISPSPTLEERKPVTDHDLQNIICDWYDKLDNPQHVGIRTAFSAGFRVAEMKYSSPSPQVTDEEIWSVAKEDYPNETIHDDENKKNTLRQKLFVIGAKWMRDQMKAKAKEETK